MTNPEHMEDSMTYADVFPHWAEGFERIVPRHMRGAVERYVLHGIPPGSFLSAVVSFDLDGAARAADEINARKLLDWVGFFNNYAPGNCYGSPERLKDWIKQGGALGSREGGVA